MTLEVRPFFNPVVQRADFIELTFTNISNETVNTTNQTDLSISYLDFVADHVGLNNILGLESSSSQQPPDQLQNALPVSNDELYDWLRDWQSRTG